MTIQPTDIAIFLISMAACMYCLALSRRLRALQNTKDGLGATIIAFSDSVSAMSDTTQDTCNRAGELVARLSHLMNEAHQVCSQVEDMTELMEAKHFKAAENVTTTYTELSARMRSVLDESKDRIVEITELTRETLELTEGTAAAILTAVHRVSDARSQLPLKVAQYHET